MCVFALFPLVYALSASLSASGSLVGSNQLFATVTDANYRQLFSDPQNPFPRWFLNSMMVSTITAIGTVLMGRRRPMRSPGSASGADARGSWHCSSSRCSPAAGLRGDLPAPVRDLRGLSGPGTELPLRPDRCVPGRGSGSEHVPDVRVLQHHPAGPRRSRDAGWGEPCPDLLADDPAARDADHRGRRHALLHRVVLRLPAGADRPAGSSPIHARGGPLPVRLGRVRGRLGVFTAGAVLSALPVVLLFLFLQRYIVAGLTGGAVKG